MGFLVKKPFLVTRNSLHQLPQTFLSSNRQVQRVANQGREGIQKPGKHNQETPVQPCGKVLVSHQGTHTTEFLSCFADTETPTRWEKLPVCCSEAYRRQITWKQNVDVADSHSTHHQPIRRISMSWSHPRWTTTIRLFITHAGQDP